jgi:PAS domain S-box-containing protein
LNPWKTLFSGLTMPDSYLASAETLLLQRGGDQAVVVNPTRCEPHAPLTVRMPLSPGGMNALALQWTVTEDQDHDYRGVHVLYATQFVSRAGWGIVVKADQRDVYASMRTTALLEWGFVMVSFLAIGNMSYALWSRRHKALLGEFSALGLRYRNLVESAHEGIWVWDPAGLTVYANGRLAQMFGCSQDELTRRPVQEFLGPKDEDRAIFFKQPGLPSQGEEHEVCLVRADGSELWALLSLTVCSGGDRGLLGLSRTSPRGAGGAGTDRVARHAQPQKADLQKLLHDSS